MLSITDSVSKPTNPFTPQDTSSLNGGTYSDFHTSERVEKTLGGPEKLDTSGHRPKLESTESAIKRLVADAPALSPKQLERLTLLIGGAL